MHDVIYSQDSDDWIDVPMPDDESHYYANTTLRVPRTAAVPGTGTSVQNPREPVNMATTWLDLSALYGSTPEVLHSLRSYSGGKLLSQEIQARGTKGKASYLPFNIMNVPTNTRPGIDPKDLFGGGDPRTNEDWMLLGIHTLLLREHNRLCDILATQHPEYDDEQLYQTIRLAMSAKYAMIANAYQMAYWTKAMPWPRDDGEKPTHLFDSWPEFIMIFIDCTLTSRVWRLHKPLLLTYVLRIMLIVMYRFPTLSSNVWEKCT